MLNSKVWLKNNDDWISGIYIGKEGDKFKVKVNDEIFIYNHIESKNDDDIDNVNNLINIPHLNEPSILNCISVRYNKDEIYTYTGKILISINPFKDFGLYEENIINNYKKLQGSVLGKPHLYQICNSTYSNIINEKRNQSILVSGESGAGKTHSTKVIMQYLAYISGKGEDIKNKIISSNPILEAFGNAKTLFNNNSSRFGKYIKLKFDKTNKLIGASIESYLLEKIRLIYQTKGERNFHIFYQMIRGMTEEEKYKFKLNKFKYKYLNNNLLEREDGVKDSDDYKTTIESFKLLDFSDNEIEEILSITAGILNLGSIEYNDNGDVINKIMLKEISDLLKIPVKILEKTLCFRTINVNEEVYEIKLNKKEAITIRDSLSMKIYEILFIHIVKLINRCIDEDYEVFIGILDIFGFESFEYNSFEQLCINYTNENLQNQFNKYIFKLEQEEYRREGINWENIDYPDNKDILNLIDGKDGIFSSLDEECKLPKGNDEKYNNKLVKKYEDNNKFIIDKKYTNKKFGVRHYAGEVIYNSNGFCEKNSDKVSKELNLCLNSSLYNFIKLGESINSSNINAKSLSYKFRKQLKSLLTVIDKTDTHYVRCLKPNNKNLPNLFNRRKVIEQLKYCGVIEAIKVSRSGYAVRMLHENFRKKYKVLNIFKNLNNISFLNKDSYQVGKTKIFLKTCAYEKIEEMKLQYLGLYSITIQKNIRMFIKRRKYLIIIKKIVILQLFNKIILAKKKKLMLKSNKNATIIQTNYRSYILRRKFLKKIKKVNLIKVIYLRYRYKKRNNACKKIQLFIKFYLNIKKDAVIIIQKYFRRYLADISYKTIYKKIILIQREIKRFLHNKNSLIKENIDLVNKLEESKNEITKIQNLNSVKLKTLSRDISAYKECISKNIDEKVNMWNELEILKQENIRIKKKLEEQSVKKRSFWNWNFFGK